MIHHDLRPIIGVARTGGDTVADRLRWDAAMNREARKTGTDGMSDKDADKTQPISEPG